jgi:hypothetical protein
MTEGTETAARRNFNDLKAAVAALAEAQDWDAYHDLMGDVQDWVVDEVGHMNARHGGYVVTLDERVKDEDAAVMQRLFLNIRGVVAVDPVEDDPAMRIAERRALYRMKDAIEAAIYGA